MGRGGYVFGSSPKRLHPDQLVHWWLLFYFNPLPLLYYFKLQECLVMLRIFFDQILNFVFLFGWCAHVHFRIFLSRLIFCLFFSYFYACACVDVKNLFWTIFLKKIHDILGVNCLQHLWRMYCLLNNTHSMEDGHFFIGHQNDIICTTWHSMNLVLNKGDQFGSPFFSIEKHFT